MSTLLGDWCFKTGWLLESLMLLVMILCPRQSLSLPVDYTQHDDMLSSQDTCDIYVW